MTNSRAPLCIDPLASGVTPARSCGPLGANDAADPEAMTCMYGDTPGALGIGNDSANVCISPPEPNYCEIDFPVVTIDMEKMRRILYAVAYAEAANATAKQSFWSSEVELGDPQQVKDMASKVADSLMDQLLEAMKSGPEAVQDFLTAAEKRKENSTALLKAKLDEELAAGRRSVERWGNAIKFCANVKFVSTVSVKTLGVFTGFGGAGIDIVYSAVEDATSIGDSKGVVAVGMQEGGEEIVGKINELIAERGLMTQKERNQMQGWLSNYKGNAAKIHKQLDKIQSQIEQRLKKGKSAGGRQAHRLKKLNKLKELRLKTAGKLARSAGTYKKALGKTVSLVFLAKDVSEAWEQLEREHAAASR